MQFMLPFQDILVCSQFIGILKNSDQRKPYTTSRRKADSHSTSDSRVSVLSTISRLGFINLRDHSQVVPSNKSKNLSAEQIE